MPKTCVVCQLQIGDRFDHFRYQGWIERFRVGGVKPLDARNMAASLLVAVMT